MSSHDTTANVEFTFNVRHDGETCTGTLVLNPTSCDMIDFECHGVSSADFETGPWIPYKYIVGKKLAGDWVRLPSGHWVADPNMGPADDSVSHLMC